MLLVINELRTLMLKASFTYNYVIPALHHNFLTYHLQSPLMKLQHKALTNTECKCAPLVYHTPLSESYSALSITRNTAYMNTFQDRQLNSAIIGSLRNSSMQLFGQKKFYRETTKLQGTEMLIQACKLQFRVLLLKENIII